MPPTDSPALARLHRVMVGWTIFKLIVWALFLLVAPALCLQRGLVGPAILCGALGLLLDLMAVDVLLGWTRSWGPHIRRALMLYHLGVAITAGWLLVQPIDPRWTLVPATADLANTAVAPAPDGLLVLGGGDLWLHPRAAEPYSLAYPGPFAWISHTTPDGEVWVAPRDAPEVLRRRGEQWDSLPRPPGYVRALAGGRARLWIVVDNGLYSLLPGHVRWDRSNECPGATGVAVAPDDESQVLVVGKVWCISPDAGGEWIDVTPPGELAGFPEATIGGGGWMYATASGLLGSSVHARGPDDVTFTARTSPASDVRVLVADPRDGRRVWAGTWGEGVFVSEDGGASWTDFGLQRIQVRSMALDPVAQTLAAASSNTIFDKGVYVRSIRADAL